MAGLYHQQSADVPALHAVLLRAEPVLRHLRGRGRDGTAAAYGAAEDGWITCAVSGSQARLLKPVIRHWSEVADPDQSKEGHRLGEEQKFDEFFQTMEKPFDVSMFAENQMVMKNIQTGKRVDIENQTVEEDQLIHYQGVDNNLEGNGNELRYVGAFDGRYGTGGSYSQLNRQNGDFYDYNSWWDNTPAFDDIGGGYEGDVDAERAYYPLPVLSNLLPEGNCTVR